MEAAGGSRAPGAIDAERLASFRRLVEQRAGIALDTSKDDSLAEAVAAVANEAGVSDPDDLLARCRLQVGDVWQRLIRRLTIRETYFFRNRPHFRALREVILPQLLEAGARDRRLRIWSAGCSTGEEPYSVAMALGDVALQRGVDLSHWDALVLGTDLDPAALETARRAEYGRYSFRGVSPEEIERYFEPAADGHRVRARHRRLVEFAPFNLKTDRFPEVGGRLWKLDLILCRNVTIYFGPETTRQVADQMHDTLRDGGYLVVGHAEHSLETFRRFETHALPDAILYRRGTGEPPAETRPAPDWSGLVLPAPARIESSSPTSPRRLPTPIPAPLTGVSEASVEAGLADARQALRDGDLDRAVDVAVHYLERSPEDPDACLLLGELAADRGNVTEARIWLRRTVELRPLDVTAHYVLALLAAEAGDLREALDDLKRALYVEPGFLMGHYLAIRLLRELGRDDAVARHRRAAERECQRLADGSPVPCSEGLTVAAFRELLAAAPLIRVLLADDSTVVLDIVERLLEEERDIEIVGRARDGREAVELTRRLRPDLVLMDVRMPVLDGIEATAAIMAEAAVPILVLSGSIAEDASIAFRAIQAGAIDVVEKPSGTLRRDYEALREDLVRRVRLVSRVPPIRRGRVESRSPVATTPRATERLVVMGASTGGPPAFATILGAFAADFVAPILAVQHISAGFVEGFVDWLDSSVPPKVVVAERGELPEPGKVYFPPEDCHLVVDASGRLAHAREAPRDGHRPSVSVLFESVAAVHGDGAVGVLLTGMGRDGADGLLALHEAGARTICQDAASSVVHGMPAAAVALGAADVVTPLELVATEVVRALERGSG